MLFTSRRALRPFLPLFALALGAISNSAHAQAPVSASVSAANKAQLVRLVQESHVTDIWPSKIVATFNFKLSSAAWAVLLSKDGVNAAGRQGRNVGKWVLQQGIGDLEKLETSNNNDRKSMQSEVDALIGVAKTKIGLSVEATQPKMTPAQGKLLLAYLNFLTDYPENNNWMPRGGRANFKLIFSSSAKDVAVSASKDATNFTVIAPAKEPIDWGGKIEKALGRFKK